MLTSWESSSVSFLHETPYRNTRHQTRFFSCNERIINYLRGGGVIHAQMLNRIFVGLPDFHRTFGSPFNT